jgi:hypothetical protein
MTTRKKAPKDIQISFRCSSRFKNILIALAESQNRSLSNMLEVAVVSYSRTAGQEPPGAETGRKPAKKKAAKKR